MSDPQSDRGGATAVRTASGGEIRHRQVLWAMTALSGTLFLTAFAAGRVAGAHALEAAGLGPLGAAVTYGLNLVAGGAPPRTRQAMALTKASLLTAVGLAVLGSTTAALVQGGAPLPALMGGVGLALLAAQLAAMLLLLPCRASRECGHAFEAARQGAIAQGLVVIAAGCVWASGSDWPDLVVAANLAALFLLSTLQVLRQSWIELRTGEDHGALASHGFHKDFA